MCTSDARLELCLVGPIEAFGMAMVQPWKACPALLQVYNHRADPAPRREPRSRGGDSRLKAVQGQAQSAVQGGLGDPPSHHKTSGRKTKPHIDASSEG